MQARGGEGGRGKWEEDGGSTADSLELGLDGGGGSR